MPVPLPLRMIPATAPRVPRAGFLPGSDVAAWLEEMARHPEMTFFIVPGSAEDLEPGGLLLVPSTVGDAPMRFGPRVQPAAMEHGCVAVPLPMQLDPQMTREEAGRLLNYDFLFFHPSIGLIAFDKSDAIQPEVLVVPPLRRQTSWMHAMPGRSALPALHHIALALSEELDGLFGDASQDIGSANPKDLQNDSGKGAWIKDAMGNAIGTFGSWIVSGLSKMASGGAGDAGKSSGAGASGGKEGRRSPLWNKIQNWTADQLAKLQRQREGQIQRLLKMLEKDPEKGLRYALPISSAGDSARGTAPPSASLSERIPMFGMRGSGGPADVWHLSSNTQWALRQKYLDLANRELAIGNFDRAAYIFAHLLGDWHAAAGALVRGKRFQEAARIYQEKLNNKPLAASCLEDGGLLAEAVLLYAELEKHEKCGDLLRKLGREDDAVEAYRRAIAGNSGRIHDARILYDKLHQPGLAIAVLASGWPYSNEARACLEAHFEYLKRLDAHDDALAIAVQLGDSTKQLHPPMEMARTLHAIREKQSDARVRQRLSTVAFTTIGHAMKSCSTGQEQTFVEILRQFEPSDLLLRRDAIRFAETRVQSRSPARLPAPAKKPGEFTKVQQWPMQRDEGVEWNRLLTSDDTWLARGFHRRAQQETWMLGARDATIGKLTSGRSWASGSPLQPHLLRDSAAWLPFSTPEQTACYGSARREDFRNPPGSSEPLISRLAWMPPRVLAVCPTSDGVWVLHEREHGTIDLSYSTQEGKLRRTHALGISQDELPGLVQMAVHGDHVFISAGCVVLHVKHGRVDKQVEVPFPVSRLTASQPTHPPSVLVAMPGEVMLLSPDGDMEPSSLFTSSGGGTFATYLGDGRIACGDFNGGKLFSGQLNLKVLSPIAHDFIAVDYAPWSVDSLAILSADGIIRIYR